MIGVHIEDGTYWPTPGDKADPCIEWVLRYGNLADLERIRYQAASIVSGYRSLIHCPETQRRKVIRALRAADHADAEQVKP